MEPFVRGRCWLVLVLIALPPLTCGNICLMSTCICRDNGYVKCEGHSVTDILQLLPDHTSLLELNGTDVSVINARFLAEQELLLRFSLTYSRLHTIHPLAFHGAPQLLSVKLSFNRLAALPVRVFSPLTVLEQLHLNGNQLEAISPELLSGLAKLKDLDLNSNQLTNLSSEAFQGLTSLMVLNLGKNSFKRLPPTIFKSLTNLRHLYMYYNELDALEPGQFDDLVKLNELKIHYNQIARLPPQVFWPLRNLMVLTLSSNRLQVIPEKSFYNMPKLTKLTIYNNPLLSLPEQLMGHMPKIREFHLYNTNLTTVPGNVFANMSDLLMLKFHFNKKLSDLPADLFCCLPHLQELSLKSNNLHDLHPQLFSRLTSLRLLYLNDNKLHSLPENIFQAHRGISIIELKNNLLKTLPGDIFLSNTVLRTVTLGDNSWDCTCGIRDLVKWIRQNKKVVEDLGDVMCHSPVYQLLRTLDSLRDDEFIFCDVTTSFLSNKDLSATTRPFRSSARTTTPKVTHPATTTQHANPTTSDLTTISTPVHAVTTEENNPPATEGHSAYTMSHVFRDLLVIGQGPEFVHHNTLGGWVYVWFLPADTVRTGLLMFCHILLVTTGLCLILASMYGMYRLGKIIDKLTADEDSSAHERPR